MILLDVPTGDSSATVQEYYQYLYAHYLGLFSQQVGINWTIFAWVLLWIVLMVGGFFFYTRYQRQTKQEREPYPVESYDGHIQEMNGPVGPFLWITFVTVAMFVLITMVLNLMNGQIY